MYENEFQLIPEHEFVFFSPTLAGSVLIFVKNLLENIKPKILKVRSVRLPCFFANSILV